MCLQYVVWLLVLNIWSVCTSDVTLPFCTILFTTGIERNVAFKIIFDYFDLILLPNLFCRTQPPSVSAATAVLDHGARCFPATSKSRDQHVSPFFGGVLVVIVPIAIFQFLIAGQSKKKNGQALADSHQATPPYEKIHKAAPRKQTCACQRREKREK